MVLVKNNRTEVLSVFFEKILTNLERNLKYFFTPNARLLKKNNVVKSGKKFIWVFGNIYSHLSFLIAILTILSFFIISPIIADIPGDIQWQRSYGGSVHDFSNYLISTPDGGLLIGGKTGSINGDVTNKHGPAGWATEPHSPTGWGVNEDLWVLKTENNGAVQWSKCYGGSVYSQEPGWWQSGSDYFGGMSPTNDGGNIIAGTTTSDDGDVSGLSSPIKAGALWVIKTEPNGTIQWNHVFGGSVDSGGSTIRQTSDNGYIVLAHTASNDVNVSGNHGGRDIWILKLNSLGIILWQKCLGGSSDEIANSLEITPDNGYIIGGQTNSNDGNVSGNKGSTDAWIVKLDQTGNLLWQKCFGGIGDEGVISIKNTNDGNFIATGYTTSNNEDFFGNHGGQDIFVAKINSTGSIIWSRCFGGTGNDIGNSIIPTSDSGFLVAGVTNSVDGNVSSNHGDHDGWLLSIDQNGSLIWNRTYGGPGCDALTSITQTTDGGYALGGQNSADGGDISGNHGTFDIWVAKLARGSVSTYPVINAISPSSGLNTAPISITNISGHNFRPNLTVQLTRTGFASKSANNISLLDNGTRISCVVIPSRYEQIGHWNVKVTNSDSTNVTLVNGLKIDGLWPTIGSITPINSINNGSLNFNITGTNLWSLNTTVALTRTGYPSINATNINRLSNGTRIWGVFQINNASLGSYNVTVTNPDGTKVSLPNGFTITNHLIPPVAAFTTNITSGNAPLTVQLTDTSTGGRPTVWNWSFGDGRWFNFTGNYSSVTTNVTYYQPGIYPINLRVSNSAGESSTSPGTYITTNATPPIASYTANITSGNAPLTVQLTDTSTGGRPTIWNWSFGDGRWFNFTGNYSSVTTNVTYYQPGVYPVNLRVSNLAGDSATSPGIPITVTSNTTSYPSISSITPSSVMSSRGMAVISVYGSNFTPGSLVTLSKTGFMNITPTVYTERDSNHITCTLPVQYVSSGYWNVVVTNPDGLDSILSNGLLITESDPNHGMAITGISMPYGQNTSDLWVQFYGSGFTATNNITIVRSDMTNITVSANQAIPGEYNRIYCTLPLTQLTSGYYEIFAENADGDRCHASEGFMVYSAGSDSDPTIDSITPNSVPASGPIQVQIQGSGFQTGATAGLSTWNGFIKAENVTVVSSTLIIATLPIQGIWSGDYTPIVVNPDGSGVQLPYGFQILMSTPEPVTGTINPEKAPNSAPFNLSIQTAELIDGIGFQPGSQITIYSNSGMTYYLNVKNIWVISPTKISCDIDPAMSPAGNYSVWVIPRDASQQRLIGYLNLTGDPSSILSITSVSPSSGMTGNTIPLVIEGNGFNSSAYTVYFSSGVAPMMRINSFLYANDVTVLNSTALSCNLDLSGPSMIDPGFYTVTVYDEIRYQSASLPNGFSIQLDPNLTPPQSVTNLINTTYNDTSINWTWNDPTDSDFSHVMVYLNGEFVTNISKGIEHYNATNLSSGSPYTIGTQTVDTQGNINSTWIEHTANTFALTQTTIRGQVFDSVTSMPIPYAQVSISGLSTTSDSNGNYRIVGIPPGGLTAEFTGTPLSGPASLLVSFSDLSENNVLNLTAQKSGYQPFSNSLISIEPEQTLQYDIPLTPIGSEDEYRIVLTWAENPADLDSHLVTPAINGNSHHVYYSNLGSQTSAPFANLDRDDTTSYGPETVTIKQALSGTYNYYIHHFAGTGSISTTSNAVVNVYKGSSLIGTFNAPITGTGIYWQVFNLEGATGVITPINIISDSPQTSATGISSLESALPPKKLEKSTLNQFILSQENPVTLASDPITSWSWNFGDGTSNVTTQNPQHLFTAPGSYNISLMVTSLSGSRTKIKNNFVLVTTSPDNLNPVISNITPTSGLNTGPITITNISGVNFRPNLTVQLSRTGFTTKTATNVSVLNNGTRVSCIVTPYRYDLIGAWNVTIRNSDNTNATLINGLTIDGLWPNISSISPVSSPNTGKVNITVTGTNFWSSLTTIQLSRTGYPTINGTNLTRLTNGTQMGGQFLLTDSTPGSYNLTIRNPDGTNKTLINGFTVTSAPIYPVASFTANTSGGTPPLAVQFTDTSSGSPTAWNWSFGDGTWFNTTNSAQRNATKTFSSPGSYIVKLLVSNAVGSNMTNPGTVITATSTNPVISSISPTSGLNTGPITISNISGVNFRTNLTVQLSRTGYTTKTATNVSVLNNGTRVSCIVTPYRYDLIGAWNVTIRNSDNTNATLINGLTIDGLWPNISSISPVSSPNIGKVNITVTGTNFWSSLTTIQLSRTGYPPINGTNLTRLTNGTQMGGQFLLTNSTPGSYNLTIRNPDGTNKTLINGFTVTSAPIYPVASFTANTSGGTPPLAVQFTDTSSGSPTAWNWSFGDTTWFNTTNSAQRNATKTFSSPGSYTVKLLVSNAIGSNMTNPGTVITATSINPVISSISPTSGLNTGPITISNISGVNFRPNLTVQLSRTGFTTKSATNVSVLNNGTRINCIVTPYRYDLIGAWNVTVRNSDNTNATLVNGLTIDGLWPNISSISPVSSPNIGKVNITVTGTNFWSSLTTIQLSRTGYPTINGTNLTRLTNGTQMGGQFLLTNSTPGLYNLTIRNPDGTNITLVNGFTVTTQTSTVDLLAMNLTGPAQIDPALESQGKVTMTLMNGGTSQAPGFWITYYLSPDQVISSADTKIGQVFIQNLSALRTVAVEQPIRAPVTISSGVYYYGAVVDSLNQTNETNKTNNVVFSSGTVSIGVTKPDLIFRTLDLNATSVDLGATTQVQNTIGNIGKYTAGPSWMNVYLSSDQAISSEDFWVGQRQVPSLNAGDASSSLDSIEIPIEMNPGFAYLVGMADSTNLVNEINESNNTAVDLSPVIISNPYLSSLIQKGSSGNSASDISIGGVTTPRFVAPGNRTIVSFTLNNSGSQPVKDVYTTWYFSNDSAISRDDVYIGQIRIREIPVGLVNETGELTVPSFMREGPYYLYGKLDPLMMVQDANRENNVGFNVQSLVISRVVVLAQPTVQPEVVNSTTTPIVQNSVPKVQKPVGVKLDTPKVSMPQRSRMSPVSTGQMKKPLDRKVLEEYRIYLGNK